MIAFRGIDGDYGHGHRNAKLGTLLLSHRTRKGELRYGSDVLSIRRIRMTPLRCSSRFGELANEKAV